MVGVWSGIGDGVRSIREDRLGLGWGRDGGRTGGVIECTLGL